MPLKIIGAGYGRTGTMSTYTALNQLGFPCYHMMEVLQNEDNKHHLPFWNQVANRPAGTQHNWEEVFENYTATVDNPGCCVWRELLEAYPDAKVLLTLHPWGPEVWFESTIDTIYFTENRWQFRVLRIFTPFGRMFGNMSSKLIWQRSHQGTLPDKAAAVARYRQHIEEVKAAVPPEQLLIFQVDQGWGPLCEFLGVDVPEGDFPNVNDRAEIQQTIRDMSKGAYTILAMLGVALAGLIYLLTLIF